jgi:DNA-binding CsgD family transcriptional regulator
LESSSETKIALPAVPVRYQVIKKFYITNIIIYIWGMIIDEEVYEHKSRKDQVREYYEKFGASIPDMVRTFGIKEQMIRMHLKGIYKSTMSVVRGEEILEMHKLGMTDYAIAKHLGVTNPTVKWHLDKHYASMGIARPVSKRAFIVAARREIINSDMAMQDKMIQIAGLEKKYIDQINLCTH